MKILLIVSLLIPLILGSDNQSQQSGYQDQQSQQSGYQDQQSQQCSYQDQQSGQCQNPAKNAEIGNAIAAFALKVYKQITALGPRTTKLEPKGFYENAICAPISIFQMYALMLQGAGSGSETYNQIKQVLELNGFQNDKEINVAMHQLIKDLNSKDRVSKISTGNAIFLGERAVLTAGFNLLMNKYYKVYFERILFILAEEAMKKINGYIRLKTNNKIQNFITHLRQNTNMVLVDYLYFKGEWNEPFGVKGMTVDGEFKLIDGSTVEVPTMHAHGIYKTYRDKTLNCKVIELPYKGSVSLIIVVPTGDIHRLGQSLTIETLKKWKTSMASSLVDVFIPKFSVNQQLDVKAILQELGVEDVFTKQADLTRMGLITPVSDSMHQAVLDVTDAGTVASGSSDIITAEVTSPEFKVNTPFIFMVQDSQTNSVLLIGRYMGPRKAQ